MKAYGWVDVELETLLNAALKEMRLVEPQNGSGVFEEEKGPFLLPGIETLLLGFVR
jgi:hypothetical protein